MKKLCVIDTLRIGAFLSFLCILVRLNLEFNFTDPILINFPLFSSVYFPAMHEKVNSSLIFPIVVNAIVWVPIKKSYSIVHGMVWFEKWKTFFLMIFSGLVCIVASLFVGLYSVFWGFLISMFYYIYLRYALKALEKKEFLVQQEIDDFENKIDDKKLKFIFFIHIIVIFFVGMEYQICTQTGGDRMPVKKIEIPNAYIRDISGDGKKVLLLKYSKGESLLNRGKLSDIVVLDLEKKKELWKRRAPKSIGILKFSETDKNVFVSGVNDEIDGEKLEIYDSEKGDIIKEVNFKERKFPRINKVGFNENGTFFFESGNWESTVWEYENKKRIASYKEPESNYDLAWLNKNRYIISRKYKYSGDEFWGYKMEISGNEILENKRIKEKVKKIIASDMDNKIKKVGYGNMFVKEIDENSICTVISGEGEGGVFKYIGYIDFWEVETERKEFSLITENPILDVVFLPRENQFIVMEKTNNRRLIVSFWNLEEKKKEKVVSLKGIEDVKRKNIKIIKTGEELVLISGDARIWKLD